MPRRSGPIELQLQNEVARYLAEHGHGAASTLGRAIRRPSSWVGHFSRDTKHATVDDAAAIVKALRLSSKLLFELARGEALPAIDEAQAALEARWRRLLHRVQADPDLLQMALEVVEAIARKRAPRKRS